MEEETGSTETTEKANEPLITVPNPRAHQQSSVLTETNQGMFTTLETFDTEYSADAVEWCPTEGYKDIFVCGTYQLVEGEEEGSSSSSGQKRLGRIYLFQVVSLGRLNLMQKLDTQAILDMKWSQASFRGDTLLGVVNSSGYLQLYRLKRESNPALELITEKRVRNSEEELVALSLDWNNGRWESDGASQAQITVSDSKGAVSLYTFDGERIELGSAKKLHDFEAWIAAFDYWCPNTVYSGGDDCKFLRLDARMGLDVVAANKKHGAGVTSIRSSTAKECCVATGSYDEILRIWDTRNLQTPMSGTNLKGGVWRLKWDPFDRNFLLAACMHGGFRIIDCYAILKPRIIAEYDEHESIAYGCDWSLLDDDGVSSKIFDKKLTNVALAATCSFYDHTLKLSYLCLPDY